MDRLSAGGEGLTARELVGALGLRRLAGDRPRVAAAMIASADGRTTVKGRSGPLGHPEDRDLLRELRTEADAILVGTGTLRAERYKSVLDPHQIEHRRAAGRAEQPVVATVSRRGDLRRDEVPLFDEPGARVHVFTETAEPDYTGAAADVRVTALGEGFGLDAVLRALHEEQRVLGVTCEGGPGLLREMVAQGLVDDLLVTLSPQLVAGEGPTVLTGAELDPPPRFAVQDVLRADDHLFLHYVPAP